MHGGAADRSGLIHVGDEVIEVNGINVEGKTPGDVLQILVSVPQSDSEVKKVLKVDIETIFSLIFIEQQNSEGTITFKLVPSDARIGQRESKVRVKAYFDYNPENDPYIPCKEAGLGFTKGDVLHIVSQDDAYWWQARKETEKTARAGLIPSRALQERRIIHERNQNQTNGDSKRKSLNISLVNNRDSVGIHKSLIYLHNSSMYVENTNILIIAFLFTLHFTNNACFTIIWHLISITCLSSESHNHLAS